MDGDAARIGRSGARHRNSAHAVFAAGFLLPADSLNDEAERLRHLSSLQVQYIVPAGGNEKLDIDEAVARSRRAKYSILCFQQHPCDSD